MKRKLSTLLVIMIASVSLVGCTTSSSTVNDPVSNMITSLYFGDGTYADYKQNFSDPSKVITEAEFNKIREKGPKGLFGDKSASDAVKQLRSYEQDQKKTAVVYWVDFALDKSHDLRWTVVETGDGWKIQN